MNPVAPVTRIRMAESYQLVEDFLYKIHIDRLALALLECQTAVGKQAFDGGPRVMKLKPLGDRLIVKPLDEEETTASGIVLPDTAKEKPQKGEVLAVGDGRWDE